MNIVFLFVMSFSLFFFVGCVEAIDYQAETYESAIVIDARITNEEKQQIILLSRVHRFGDENPNPETSAAVQIIGGNTVYVFEEIEGGVYASITPFKALPGVSYKLEITTNDGRLYVSSPTSLTTVAQIDNLYAERVTNDDGVNGMSIYIDSSDPLGESKYYRYEYEETYKIIAPSWVPEDLVLIDVNTCELLLTTRSQEERVCYKTEMSTAINLMNTSSLTEDRVVKHPIRFINSNDFILSHRYSILVRQFIESEEAYTYFETLNDISSEGSIFSQNQPGFFRGNVFSENDSSEKVVGFFSVSSVTSRRIYFNYEDFYPNEAIPSLPYNCVPRESQQYAPSGACGPLVTRLFFNRATYVYGASIDNTGVTRGPFFVVNRRCGDCTALGSNIVPNFWID